MKNVLYLSAFALSFYLFACGSAEEQKHQEVLPAADTSKGVSAMITDSAKGDLAYICPCGGCPEIRESKPGKCSKCEMDLVEEKK